MNIPIMLLVLVLGPILLAWWSVHVVRRWRGPWRFAPVLPLTMVSAGLIRAVVSLRSDLGRHSGWGMDLLLGISVAAIAAFLLQERHDASMRTAQTPPRHR